MRDQVEFRRQLIPREQHELSAEELGKRPGLTATMVNKIICGDVIPSSHLEKQMIEALGIDPDRIEHLAGRRRNRATAAS